jgi:hypothetical protein
MAKAARASITRIEQLDLGAPSDADRGVGERHPYFAHGIRLQRSSDAVFPIFTATWHAPGAITTKVIVTGYGDGSMARSTPASGTEDRPQSRPRLPWAVDDFRPSETDRYEIRRSTGRSGDVISTSPQPAGGRRPLAARAHRGSGAHSGGSRRWRSARGTG